MAKKPNQAKLKQVKNHSLATPTKLTTFSDHIKELRRRVLWVALVFLVASGVAYNFHDQLVYLVMQPLDGQKLIYLTPGGGFSFIFQITLYAGLIVAAPMMSYQLYAFVRPALPLYARRSATKVVGFAVALMLIGVSYGYFVAVPAALHFLSTFAGSEILPSLTADSYLNFFLSYVAGLALLFQLPLLLIFWHWIKPMKPGGLLKSERFIILFAFIAAALITPTPDIVNQSMIAVPLIAIYQIGVVAVLVMIHRTKRKQKAISLPIAQPVVAPQEVEKVNEPKPLQPATTAQSLTRQPAPTTIKPLPVKAMKTVDGFVVRRQLPQPHAAQPKKRDLHVPERPAASNRPLPLMRRRQVFGIDGMSPM